MIENAQAHEAGKVWCKTVIDGGSVPQPGKGRRGGIGKVAISGPLEPWQSFVLCMAAKGLSPTEIENECRRFGVVLPTKVRSFS